MYLVLVYCYIIIYIYVKDDNTLNVIRTLFLAGIKIDIPNLYYNTIVETPIIQNYYFQKSCSRVYGK